MIKLLEKDKEYYKINKPYKSWSYIVGVRNILSNFIIKCKIEYILVPILVHICMTPIFVDFCFIPFVFIFLYAVKLLFMSYDVSDIKNRIFEYFFISILLIVFYSHYFNIPILEVIKQNVGLVFLYTNWKCDNMNEYVYFIHYVYNFLYISYLLLFRIKKSSK